MDPKSSNDNDTRKVLALLTTNPQFIQFGVPQLKSLLSPLQIPLSILFSLDQSLAQEQQYKITQSRVNNFPYIILTIPNFSQHRQFLQQIGRQAVMLHKLVLLISQGSNYQQLINNTYVDVLEDEQVKHDQTIVCDFVSRNRVIQRDEQVHKIHKVLKQYNIRGIVDIKNGHKRYQIIQQHKWYQNHHEVDSSKTLQKVSFGVELSSFRHNNAKFNIKYSLSNRIYLGPTSADNDLAFLMCNQAQIKAGDIVFDPFVGTAGLLIPPASYGAEVFGCDLDMRVINGYSVGRINKKSKYYSKQKGLQTFTPKIYLNFDQYELPRPNIIRMDCTKCAFAQHCLFDAIISDPPYGIRAMSRSTKKKENCIQSTQQQNKQVQIEDKQQKQQKLTKQVLQLTIQSKQKQCSKQQQSKEQQLKKLKKQHKKQNKQTLSNNMSEQQKQFKQDIADKLNKQRTQNWQSYSKMHIQNTQRHVIFDALLTVGRKHLKKGGRLVFLYPIYDGEQWKGAHTLPQYQGYQLIDMSQNQLSGGNSRILVTLMKI